MTDGHEVSSDTAREDYARRILAQVEAGNGESQRSLARSAGIALGLTNLILRKLVRKGWVRITRVQRNRVRYLITPTGIAEKARMSSLYFTYTTRFYAEARDRIRDRFDALSMMSPRKDSDRSVGKRIVFYGASEVAEIGFVCLQSTDLTLVGVVDDERSSPFMGLTVHRTSQLRPGLLGTTTFDVLVVMSFADQDRLQRRLDAVGFAGPVFWI